eukprot:6200077-Pleurochrysis_carterae.AAC.1
MESSNECSVRSRSLLGATTLVRHDEGVRASKAGCGVHVLRVGEAHEPPDESLIRCPLRLLSRYMLGFDNRRRRRCLGAAQFAKRPVRMLAAAAWNYGGAQLRVSVA